MIIWIASYPKSGNTWVRAFISSLLYTENGTNDFSKLNTIKQFPTRKLYRNFINDFQNVEEVYKNWINVQSYINLDNKIKFLKTHHANITIGNYKFTDDENTIGTIHIVRDPRNIITSIKNHFTIDSFENAKNFILGEKNCIGVIKDTQENHEDNKIPTLISSWKTHYLSWRKKTKNIPTAIYFHENQISYPWSPRDRDKIQNRDNHYGFINYVCA